MLIYMPIGMKILNIKTSDRSRQGKNSMIFNFKKRRSASNKGKDNPLPCIYKGKLKVHCIRIKDIA